MKTIGVRAIKVVMLALVFSTGVGLAGCEEGPVEEAGEEVDDALDDANDALD